MIYLAVFGALAILLGGCRVVVVCATRDSGSHTAARERPRLRAAAGWVALGLSWAIDTTGETLAWCLDRPRQPLTWVRDAIRRRIQRLHASPAVIPPAGNPDLAGGAHMDALQRLDRPWGDDTGSFTRFVEAGE